MAEKYDLKLTADERCDLARLIRWFDCRQNSRMTADTDSPAAGLLRRSLIVLMTSLQNLNTLTSFRE